jgi:hypothetical protein
MRKLDKLKAIQEANKRILNEMIPPDFHDDDFDSNQINYNTVISNISKELTKEILDTINSAEQRGRPDMVKPKVESTIYSWLLNNSDSVTNLGYLANKSGYNSKY